MIALGKFCSKCGVAVLPDARFCKSCGAQLPMLSAGDYLQSKLSEDFSNVVKAVQKAGKSFREETKMLIDSTQVKCPVCGVLNPKEMKFCSSCGFQLLLECSICGKELDFTKKFCPYCGASINVLNKCPSCGAMVDKEQKFCLECGTPMSGKKVCKACGAELAEGQKFCGKCGAKME